MPFDPVRLEDTRSWFVKAGKDLRRAEVCLSPETADAEDALFHCQQAVEKAVKGFLTRHDQPFRKTHDLGRLGAQCVGLDTGLQALVARVEGLTEYAWKFRYPGAPYEPTLEEAQDALALALAREAVDVILSRLPEEVRP